MCFNHRNSRARLSPPKLETPLMSQPLALACNYAISYLSVANILSSVGLDDWLEGAAINIFSMSCLHYYDNKFIILNTVYNAVTTLAYAILVISR